MKTPEEFRSLDAYAKQDEYAKVEAVARSLMVLHQNDEYLMAWLSGRILVRVIFNGEEKPTRKHLEELIKLLEIQRDAFTE